MDFPVRTSLRCVTTLIAGIFTHSHGITGPWRSEERSARLGDPIGTPVAAGSEAVAGYLIVSTSPG